MLTTQVEGLQASVAEKIDRNITEIIVQKKYEDIVEYLQDALQSSAEDEDNFKNVVTDLDERLKLLSTTKCDKKDIMPLQETIIKTESDLSKAMKLIKEFHKNNDHFSKEELLHMFDTKLDKEGIEHLVSEVIKGKRKKVHVIVEELQQQQQQRNNMDDFIRPKTSHHDIQTVGSKAVIQRKDKNNLLKSSESLNADEHKHELHHTSSDGVAGGGGGGGVDESDENNRMGGYVFHGIDPASVYNQYAANDPLQHYYNNTTGNNEGDSAVHGPGNRGPLSYGGSGNGGPASYGGPAGPGNIGYTSSNGGGSAGRPATYGGANSGTGGGAGYTPGLGSASALGSTSYGNNGFPSNAPGQYRQPTERGRSGGVPPGGFPPANGAIALKKNADDKGHHGGDAVFHSYQENKPDVGAFGEMQIARSHKGNVLTDGRDYAMSGTVQSGVSHFNLRLKSPPKNNQPTSSVLVKKKEGEGK
jgi:hypothetical protein